MNVEFANSIYSAIRGWIESALNWYYISALVIMLFVCIYLMFSRFGNVKLGDDDSKPEFSNFSWFAMLFSAGVGIGLLFFGIAEPIFYFDNTAPWGYPNNPFADHAMITEMNEDRAVLETVKVLNLHSLRNGARLRSRPIGRWPATVFNQASDNTAEPGEKRLGGRSARGRRQVPRNLPILAQCHTPNASSRCFSRQCSVNAAPPSSFITRLKL